MSNASKHFTDASSPATVTYPEGKLDRQLKEWRETDPELYEVVTQQLRDPGSYSSRSIEKGFARVGFSCSESTIIKWRRRNLDVFR